ncbi:hypothetical protein [Streptococcus sp. CSL10205-OR2]|uniref:hypothetical protein n=1 Tax=Streptococcus sp. CSL10205-OR2 TaxID=2980558 RepID=UPI0021D9B7F6|nr:hypothetical protein [Streptococcus sp. CSL10205-OR2]MCU9533527.1 hypothetical protein [Streptococcus sp. CSL10205-OR2]
MYTIKAKKLLSFYAIDNERAIAYDRLRKQFVIVAINKFGMNKKLAIPIAFQQLLIIINRAILVDNFSIIFVFYLAYFLIGKLLVLFLCQLKIQVLEDFTPDDEFYIDIRKKLIKSILLPITFLTLSLIIGYLSYITGMFLLLNLGALLFSVCSFYSPRDYYRKIILLFGKR